MGDHALWGQVPVNIDWPEWVPDKVRAEIERFYSYHNGADGWHEAETRNHAPEFGSIIQLEELCGNALCKPGRFVFAWNNIGRVVYEDGTYAYVSFSRSGDDILGF